MDRIIILVFCLLLVLAAVFGVNLTYALLTGLALFYLSSRLKDFSAHNFFCFCINGIKSVGGILITFLIIGLMTALWRASGCIAAIVYYASGLIRPAICLPIAFLLNCLVSILTGTSFGTSATMGVICMGIGKACGISPAWMGGAILSGAFFGDRCSPVSTSALLVATLTETDIYANIRRMMKSAVIPFLMSVIIYTVAGRLLPGTGNEVQTGTLLSSGFIIHPFCLIPAILVLLLAFFRVNLKINLAVSCIASGLIALIIQRTSFADLFIFSINGYRSMIPELSMLIDGGGIVSMLRSTMIVMIASCYAGIFEGTGMLSFLKSPIEKIRERFGNYVAAFIVSMPVSAVSCNQTLAIMLTNQLTESGANTEERALDLEDSVVLLAALVPWSIACSVPLSTVGAPTTSIFSACFLYLLPIWRLCHSLRRRKL